MIIIMNCIQMQIYIQSEIITHIHYVSAARHIHKIVLKTIKDYLDNTSQISQILLIYIKKLS